MAGEVQERVRQIVTRIVGFAGLEVVHLELNHHPGGMVLRVYIDKEGGVTVDDCARISHQISAELDVDDPIPGAYTLEVSSPGLDRPLISDADFERFAGRRVRLSTYAPIDGRRNFQGQLIGLQAGVVRMTQDGKEVAIPRAQVARARLEIDQSDLKGTKGRHA
jgi:ribosome maturation factor RimP